MKKSAIIDIIDNDLKEMRSLLDSFRDGNTIPQDFINSLSEKHNGIAKEIALLNYWSVDTQSIKPEQPITSCSQTEQINNEKSEEKEENIISQPKEQVEIQQSQADNNVVEEISEEATPIEPIIEPNIKTIVEPIKTQTESKVNTNYANEVKMYGTPVDDIRKAFGIADRFLFQRELFANSATQFNQVVDSINSLTSFAEAHEYINKAFSWDETDPTVEAFLRAVHRRFINN